MINLSEPQTVTRFLQCEDNVELLQILKEGNERWINGVSNAQSQQKLLPKLTDGQDPRIVVLTCADSRVIPEYIFDKVIGQLFVIRVAGNVISPEVVASIEYGVDILNASLVIILGHQNCGAVTAAMAASESTNDQSTSPHIQGLVEKIPVNKEETLSSNVINNIRHQINTINNESTIIADKISNKSIDIIGMLYMLESGKVSVVSPIENQ